MRTRSVGNLPKPGKFMYLNAARYRLMSGAQNPRPHFTTTELRGDPWVLGVGGFAVFWGPSGLGAGVSGIFRGRRSLVLGFLGYFGTHLYKQFFVCV